MPSTTTRALHDRTRAGCEAQHCSNTYATSASLPVLSADLTAGVRACRAQVLSRLPRLKVLDGSAVSKEEQAHASSLLQQEQAHLAVMLRNACLVHKMVRGCRH